MLAVKKRYQAIRNGAIILMTVLFVCFMYFSHGVGATFEGVRRMFLFEGDWRISFFLYTAFTTEILLILWLRYVASFRCPFCNMVIDADIDWVCAYCGKAHHNPTWHTILYRCSRLKCRSVPEAFECPHCKKIIPLTVETPNSSTTTRIARRPEDRSPPAPPPPRVDPPFP
jgi:hypothetical protein